jgi:hypothetical protein
MPAYYAVTRRNGQWSYICAGHDPEGVYRQAVAILTDAEAADDSIAHSPDEERAMDNMRVIPEVTAKGLRITYPRTVVEE